MTLKRFSPAISCVLAVSLVLGSTLHSSAADIDAIAKSISKGGIGVPKQSAGGNSIKIIVFEETHTSRVGQVEIAIMLLRLYRNHGMRHIAQEGFTMGAAENADWLRAMSTSGTESVRIATQLLEEGEINAAEYMAILSKQVAVHPIEKAAEYAVDLQGTDAAAPTVYLVRIGLASLIEKQDVAALQKIKILQNQNNVQEMVEHVIESDPWTKEKMSIFKAKKPVQVEDFMEVLEELEKKTVELNVQLEPADKQAMQAIKRFFTTAHERSRTMVAEALKIAPLSGESPTALSIGAAHTDEVCRLLAKAGVSYAVVTPRSLHDGATIGDLSIRAFERRKKRYSVDWNKLGALLDGRKKEPYDPDAEPKVIKGQIYLLIDRLAIAAAQDGGGEPPFGLDYGSDLDFGESRVVEGSIRRIGDNLIFRIEVHSDEPEKRKVIWVRSKHVGRPVVNPATARANANVVEALLLVARNRLQKADEDIGDTETQQEPKSEQNPDPSELPRDEPSPIIEVSSDTIARVSLSEEAILKAGI